MSPEQTRGDTVDHRTDMWSLGVVLYEMLTGERPFKGTYEQAIIYSVLHEAPEPIADVNPDVPGDLEHVVTMCLEKEPSLRYPSMADLLADLEVFAQDTDEHLSTAIRTIMRQRRKAKRLVMAGLGMLAVLLVALTALLVWQTLQAGPPSHAGRQHIAVLPLTNNLGDTPENQALANGLMQQVTSTIARMETQQTAFWVVPAGEIVQKGIETASEARKIFGVDRVVTGSVQPVGAKTELILNLVDPEGMGILNTLSVTAELGQGFREAMQRVLADLLDAGLDTQVLQAISPTGSTSPNAYAFYLQGQGYLQRYDKPGNLDNAITLFEQALAEDSLYALAHAGLCEAAWEQYQATRDTLWISRALPSCDEAVRLDDQLASVHVTLGRFYYEGTSQYRKAEDELLRALELEPNNTDAYRWLGWVYHVQDQPIKAEEAHKQAVALKPDYWVTYSHLGTFYFYTGRLKEAGEQYQQIIRLTPDNYIGYNNLGIQRLDTGQEEEAERLLKRSIELKPNDLAYRNLGRLHYQRGAYAEAVQMYEQARALEANNEITWRLLGDAYYWAGDVARAQATWQRYVELAERILAAKPNDAELLGRLAATAVALGNAEQGRAYMGRLFALPTPDAYTFHFVGRTYAMLGEEDLALRYLARALEDGIPPVRIETDPWLEALRGKPGYQALRTQFLTST